MAAKYTAVVQQHGEWWIGWIEEVPGVNSQGRTRDELLDNLRDALEEAMDLDGSLNSLPCKQIWGRQSSHARLTAVAITWAARQSP
jgi:predicted RNase H-like HicB family nuclease